jgi:carboxyl-terminal processing protease
LCYLFENQKLASMVMIWGVLKCHHPAITNGALNWDNAFTSHFNAVLSAGNREELSKVYIDWIKGLGSVNKYVLPPKHDTNYTSSNRWTRDTTLFTPELANLLDTIIHAKPHKMNWYAHTRKSKTSTPKFIPYFDHELIYKDSIFPSIPMRVLTLARYWNIINYFYPYKYLVPEDWTSVLYEMMPEFATGVDTAQCRLAINKLIVKLHDNHAYYSDRYTYAHWGKFRPPFTYTFTGDTMVVSELCSDSLITSDGLQVGDIILKIDDRTIADVLNEQADYITGPNKAAKLRNAVFLLNGNTDTCRITYQRNWHIQTKLVHRYLPTAVKFISQADTLPVATIINDSIGYMDMGKLKRNEVKKTIHGFKDKKAILVDLRHYPNWTVYKLAKFLVHRKSSFASLLNQTANIPGILKAGQ